MRSFRRWQAWGGLMALLWLSACTTHMRQQAQTQQTQQPVHRVLGSEDRTIFSAFQLGVGDILTIKVYGEPDLSGTYQVYPNCVIEFPLIKLVQVCQRTPGDIQEEISKRLYKEFFRIRPTVAIKVDEFNSKKVHVFGEVEKPGRFDYIPNMTLVQAIAHAGGFKKTAARNNTRVIRMINGIKRIYRIPLGMIGKRGISDFVLIPGDIVYIPESWL